MEEVDSRALLIEGAPRVPRFAFLDQQVDGMFLLGYHAMNGTLAGTLEHTMTSVNWHKHVVNGAPWGELAIDATLAAEALVPIVMVSGDDKLCRGSARISGFTGGNRLRKARAFPHASALPAARAWQTGCI